MHDGWTDGRFLKSLGTTKIINRNCRVEHCNWTKMSQKSYLDGKPKEVDWQESEHSQEDCHNEHLGTFRLLKMEVSGNKTTMLHHGDVTDLTSNAWLSHYENVNVVSRSPSTMETLNNLPTKSLSQNIMNTKMTNMMMQKQETTERE